MWILETMAVAFGMYSALPVPTFAWNRKNMRYALAAFPLVGAVLGFAFLFWASVCTALMLPAILRGAGFCVLPALVTGGIHLDGYADVSDALASHASPERKREILRDPRCGAFAVIHLCVYFIAFFSLCCVWEPTAAAQRCLCLGFVLSRSMSGAALTVLPIAEGSSLARTFADAADKKRVRTILLVTACMCLAGMALFGGLRVFLTVLCITAAVALRCGRTAVRQFGGVSGDLAGWFLVKEEFWMLAALTAVQLWERII